jgi:hypothetical protein
LLPSLFFGLSPAAAIASLRARSLSSNFSFSEKLRDAKRFLAVLFAENRANLFLQILTFELSPLRGQIMIINDRSEPDVVEGILL